MVARKLSPQKSQEFSLGKEKGVYSEKALFSRGHIIIWRYILSLKSIHEKDPFEDEDMVELSPVKCIIGGLDGEKDPFSVQLLYCTVRTEIPV